MLRNGVRYFMAVVQHGTIRAAADELHVAQSAVSRQIQALEHELGSPLLERKPRGVELTHAGELLYSYGLDSFIRIDRLISELDALKGLKRGHVRISSIEALVPHLLPRIIDEFMVKHPQVTFSVEIAGTDRVVTATQEGAVDIGLAYCPAPTHEIDVAYRAYEPLFAVVAADHPLAVHDSISVAEVAEWPMALPGKLTGSRRRFDEVCGKQHVFVEPALETNSVELAHRFAMVGHGVSVLARLSCIESVASGRVKHIRFTEAEMAQGYIDVITMARRRLPLAAEKFLMSLRRELDSLQDPNPASDAISASVNRHHGAFREREP